MRSVDVTSVKQKVKEVFCEIPFRYSPDILKSIIHNKEQETGLSKEVMDILIENEQVAKTTHIPLCQDTGMVIVFMKVGQEVHFENGYINDAINSAIAESFQENYLRNSVVSDPLFERMNTKNNTPAIIHTEIVPGSQVELEITTKGFGSENMSRIKMCKPAEGVQGVKDFILETVELAGPNACPPMIVGVGIGGDFEKCAMLAKQALFRSVDEYATDDKYKQLEIDCLHEINQLNIGPAGLGGKTTAMKVNIETYPTHIAGMPVAVNISCHATRHARVVI